MTPTFPFVVTTEPDSTQPEHSYSILVDLSEMDDYYALFEKYGFGGNGPSWVEHIETIVEEFNPDLLDHLEFDEEGETFLAYADSPTAVDQFLHLVQPIFGDLASLNKYLSQADPENFFE